MNLILKIFYGKNNKKCQNVYIDTSEVEDFGTLVTVIRQKISYLNFIADTDLRIEYQDDEGTFVRLDDTDRYAFLDAQRCAKVVEGTESRRLKLRVSESSTPQRKMQKLSYSPDALFTQSVPNTASSNPGPSSSTSAFSNPGPSSSTSAFSNPGPSSSTSAFSNPGPSSSTSAFSRPVKKQLNFEAHSSSTLKSAMNYTSPLERYLKDAERQLSIQTDLVEKAQNNIDEFNSSIPDINNKGSPACSLCHRRENHNRVNCPYKPYKCESAFTCGDLEKHKDEKDRLKRFQQELNTEKQKLKKLKLQLECKRESKTKTVNSFNMQMQKWLLESNNAKYLSKDGREIASR